ncbi:MAG: preprotein translocase subunit SecG [Melioribacteraceae bacterium]|nr:preprotein translocase subunit SecG [Melioribacteraceae bacterium]
MFTLLVTISVIIAVLLVIVVLLQASKGGGLAGSFGGVGQFGAVFGTRRTADFLSKLTWWLAGTLMVLAIIINLFFLPGTTDKNKESIIQSTKQNVPTAPVVPTQPATQPNKK